MKKRILSMLLVLCIVCTLVPFSVFAADIISNGTCGDNLTWTLSKDGVLTVSGTGEMYNYTSRSGSNPVPWNENANLIRKAVFCDGVESIGNCALCGCPWVGTVSISDSVKRIGKSAFNGCRNLMSIDIPDGITKLEDGVFIGCTGLRSFEIPKSVKSIGNSAFSNCRNLTSIVIPDGVTSIGDDAFDMCNSLERITIPASVTSAGNFVFSDCYLQNVAFGGTPEQWHKLAITIGTRPLMHYNCTNLEDHINIEITKESICPIAGTAKYSCSCGYEYYVSAPIKHDFEVYKSVEPTCTAHGYDELKCKTCGYRVTKYHDDELVPHNYVAAVKEPACTEQGYTHYKCADCGFGYRSDYTDQTGHIAVKAEDKEPTCTEAGYTDATKCANCGKLLSCTKITAKGHDYVSGVCSRCGDIDNPFTDVYNADVYFNAVIWAYYHEPLQITGGFTATEFRPKNPCTRAQVVTFLWRAAGCPAPASSNNPFVDVSPKQANGKDNPYYTAILWAAGEGITNGTNATHFSPNDTVTRAQFVTFLYRYENEPDSAGSISIFADANQIASPYQKAVAWAVENGIAGGYTDGTFRPKDVCPRWAVLLFMYRDMA